MENNATPSNHGTVVSVRGRMVDVCFAARVAAAPALPDKAQPAAKEPPKATPAPTPEAGKGA